MDHKRIPQQALYWQVPGYKKGPGRPRANWRGVISKDLRKMGFTWEESEVAALDRHWWRRSVAQCVQLDTGGIKVKVKWYSRPIPTVKCQSTNQRSLPLKSQPPTLLSYNHSVTVCFHDGYCSPTHIRPSQFPLSLFVGIQILAKIASSSSSGSCSSSYSVLADIYRSTELQTSNAKRVT